MPIARARAARRAAEQELEEISQLFSTALRKICKKLGRRLGLPALNWLQDAAALHVVDFLGSARRAALCEGRLQCECPICLSSSNDFLILRCGHSVCATCCRSLYADPDNELKLADAARAHRALRMRCSGPSGAE